MDNSETYIKMCDCPEIQENCKMLVGDYFIDMSQRASVTIHNVDVGMRLCLINILDGIREMDTNDIWLPRQDQIQEMLPNYGHFERHINALLGFIEWFQSEVKVYPKRSNYEDLEKKYASSEQLWLAFYMHEKHSKIWDGNKWTKT